MRVLVACEFSGVVRETFAALGHDVMSCDLLPTEIPCTNGSEHYRGNIFDFLNGTAVTWNLMIAYPPCTHLSSSGARWWKNKQTEQFHAINFVKLLWDAPIERICIENPVGKLSTVWIKPDQIIQPWMFGHEELKTTCLWLKNLPLLIPTNIVSVREQKYWKMSPGIDRAKNRSRTYTGVAAAMAAQWSTLEAKNE